MDDFEGGGHKLNFLEKLKHAPPWVWIAIALAGGTLIIGYLSYKNSQSAAGANASSPTGGSQYGYGSALDATNGLGNDSSYYNNLQNAITQQATSLTDLQKQLKDQAALDASNQNALQKIIDGLKNTINNNNNSNNNNNNGGGGGGGGHQYYTVVKGDTLSGIAGRYHLSWQSLWNLGSNHSVIGGNPNLIYPGEKLQVS